MHAAQKKRNNMFLNRLAAGEVQLELPGVARDGKDRRPNCLQHRVTAGRRLQVAVQGILGAAKEDGAALVWIIRALYAIPGLREAFDTSLLNDLKTVAARALCSHFFCSFLFLM
jgi:hypothetical protein